MAEIDRSEGFNQFQKGFLPELLGLEWQEARSDLVRGRFIIRPHHIAPNGFLHAASIVALADTACGYGCISGLPDGATGFTTIELKCNFLGAVREGAVACEARLAHGGRTTQVWDAEVRGEDAGKVVALFRCTQMVLYPR